MRNAGKDIDVTARRVRDRDGAWHAVERMTVTGAALYYGRPVPAARPYGFDYHELWAFAGLDFTVSRLRFLAGARDPMDWYIETDPIDVERDVWRIRDGYLDVCLYERSGYRLEDAAELADGLGSGAIDTADAARALRALDRVLVLLSRHGNSGEAMLAELAPGLPR